tara:strand:+ start:199 stop:378 length:180 start_codon:yes stop_codon:yes gene_type:complete
MNLLDRLNIVKNKKIFKTEPGTVFRIFEIYEDSFKNESGFIPVIIKLEPEEKKLKKSIN